MSDRLKRCTAQLIAGSVRLGVFLAILWGGLLSGAPAQAQLADAPWPKFGQDVRNTGQSPSGGAGVAWQSTIGRAGTGPSIAADGTIYIGASNTFGEDSLYAISPSTGSVEWFFAPSDFRARSVQPLVAGDGTVYVGGRSSDGGLLYAVNPDGTEKWQFFDSDEIRTAPLLSADGTVFVITGDFSTGSLYALSPSSGQPLWSVDVDYSSASPTISDSGTIYIGGNDGRIYTVDASTQLADTLDTAVSGSIEGIAIRDGGVLYVSSGGNQLTAINPDNDTQLWSSSVDLFSITPPSVGPGGRVFVGAGGEVDGAIYAFDQSGNELWSTFTDGVIDTPPAVGSNGRVYVGVNNFPDTEVLALNASDGSAAWSVVTGGNISDPFAIASDGTVYAGTGNGLFSITDPELSLTPGTLGFGTIQVGGSSTREATIENTGGANLEITDVAIAGADESDFSVQSGGGPGTLVPGATRTVTIAFAPASAGTKSATLSVSSNAGSSSVNLNGAALGEPVATTNPASDVSSEGATLNGTVDPNGASTNVTFEYREVGEQDVQTVTATQSPLTGDGSTSVSATITGLTPATEYAFRVAAENEAGSDASEEQTFTTGASIPQVITDPSTEVAGRSATLNGRVNPNGGETAVRFEWGLTPEYGNETTAQESPLAASTSEQAVSAGLSDLQPGTTYHYRVMAENAAGSAAGEDRTFTTTTAPPQATTTDASEVTEGAATLNGIVDTGALETAVRFEWGLTPEYGNETTAQESPLAASASEQAVSAGLSDLQPGTTYHYRVVAENAAGSAADEDRTFTTAAAAPTATTGAATDVSAFGATLSGTVRPGGAETQVAFEVFPLGEPGAVETVAAQESPLSGTSEQEVTASVEGLAPGTEYVYRVVAENAAGSAAGDDQTFTTSVALPESATESATSITTQEATLNGRVNPNGGETAVRFEWGLTPEHGNETTAQESPLAASASEQAVSAGLSDLQPGTTYHYRVVAENAAGSAAGDDQTFTTLAPVLSISPSALSFRQAGVGDTTATQSVEIENTGNADLAISSISLSSTAHFVISDDAEASTLAPGGTRTIGVAFAPASSGVHEATLDVESNAGAGSVTLEGTGIAVNVLPPAQAISVTGEPQEITVTTTEGFQAQTGFLYHRRGGALTYDRVPLTAENATTFTASIPGTAITERGIDVYAEFIDGDLTATFPAMNPRETPLHLRTQTSSLPAVGRFEPEVYRMVTVPALPSDTDPAAVLNEYGEYEPQQWRLLRWDPQAGQAGSYRELEASQEFPALESSFTPGTAFWLVTREGTSFSVDDATSTDASGPFTLRLQPGYNQVANPFSFPVSWSAVEAPSGVDEPREALPPYGTVTVLEPWEGYWVFNRNATPVQVAIPPRESEATALTTEKQSKAPETLFEDRPPYALQLTAQLSTGASEGVLYDRHNYVGWTDEAASGFGAEDVPEVPPVGPHVRLSIAVNNMRLAGSLHPAGQRGYAWDLEVAAAVPEPFFRRKTVTVQLHHHGALPSDYELRLIDHDHDQTQLIKEDRFSVALTSAHPARRFRLVLGTPEFAEKETAAVVPRATALGAGYPNPAQSAVSFDYQLSDDQRVVIAVYDVLGRRVQTLIDREQAAGSHSVRWDGHQASGTPVASGVYVVRMQAGAFSGTRRVVIVR